MKTHDMEADQEAKRLVELLARLVRMSGKSLRSLEAELGMGSSVLSKILSGVIRPQLSYVLMICSALKIDPGHFFCLAYPNPGPPDRLVEEYLEAQGLKVKEAGAASASSAPSDDFDHRVREALFRMIDELRRLRP